MYLYSTSKKKRESKDSILITKILKCINLKVKLIRAHGGCLGTRRR